MHSKQSGCVLPHLSTASGFRVSHLGESKGKRGQIWAERGAYSRTAGEFEQDSNSLGRGLRRGVKQGPRYCVGKYKWAILSRTWQRLEETGERQALLTPRSHGCKPQGCHGRWENSTLPRHVFFWSPSLQKSKTSHLLGWGRRRERAFWSSEGEERPWTVQDLSRKSHTRAFSTSREPGTLLPSLYKGSALLTAAHATPRVGVTSLSCRCTSSFFLRQHTAHSLRMRTCPSYAYSRLHHIHIQNTREAAPP